MTPTPDHIEVARAGLWAAHCSLALHSLKAKVRDFAAGVTPSPGSKHGALKVVGFDDRWEELLAEVDKPEPVLPSTEAVRAMLETPRIGETEEGTPS